MTKLTRQEKIMQMNRASREAGELDMAARLLETQIGATSFATNLLWGESVKRNIEVNRLLMELNNA